MTKQVSNTIWIRLLLHFIPLALPITALAYLIYQERVTTVYSDLASHREILVETRTGIGKTLDQAARDLLYLSNQSGFRLFLEKQDASVGRGLVSDWRSFLAYKKLFDQLRWIDTQGRERIRINYNDGNPVAVDPRNLQDKSNRYYFRESQTLREGSIYLSYFDLNVEHGHIEFPIKPILRLATPVFDRQGQRQGILILNYLGNNLLDQLRHVHGRELWLLNAAGYWMSGPQSELEWGELLGNPQASMREIYADAWQAMQNSPSGVFEGESGFWMHETIDPGMAIQNDVTVIMKDNIRWPLVYHQAIDQYWPLIVKERYQVTGATAFLLLVTLLVIAGQLRARDDKERALRRTRVAEAETLAFLQQSPDPLISVCRDGAIVKVNRAALDYFGYSEEALLSMRVEELMPHPFRDRHRLLREGFADHADKRRMMGASRLNALLADGDVRDVAINLNYYTSLEGEMVFTASIRDMTEENRIRKALETNEKQMDFLVQNSPTAACVLTLDRQCLVYGNASLNEMFALDDTAEMDLAARHVDREGFRQALLLVGQGETVHVNQMEVDIPGRGRCWVMASFMPMRYHGQDCMLAWYANITRLKQVQEVLEQQAQYDSLTGLPNRVLLQDRLGHAMQQCDRRGGYVAVVFIDLDGFKQVNDRFGHEAGDFLLISQSQRMREVLRDSDSIGRQGGDEFVAVISDLADANGFVPLVERILAVCTEPVNYQGEVLQVSASLGVAIYPQAHKVGFEALLNQADQAMYAAKRSGKNQYCVMTAPLDGENHVQPLRLISKKPTPI